jgi:hypothetical protein
VIDKRTKLSNGYDSTYSGDVDESGMPHGYGEWNVTSASKSEGQLHIGQFEHGLFQGIGEMTSKRGEQAVGQWYNNQLNGVAQHKSADGDRYFGNWKDHKKHGFGTYKDADGGMFVGPSVEGARHGICLLVCPDGSKTVVALTRGAVVSMNSGLFEGIQLRFRPMHSDPKTVQQCAAKMNGLCTIKKSHTGSLE